MIEKLETQRRTAVWKVRSQLGNTIRDVQAGKAEHHRLPDLAKAGQMKSFLACVAHDLLQIQIERFPPVGIGGLFLAVLSRKKGMAGEAEGGIVETDRLKILPGGQLFLPTEQLRHTRHQQQYVRLLDDL